MAKKDKSSEPTSQEATKKTSQPDTPSEPDVVESESANGEKEENGRGVMFYMFLGLGGTVGLCLLLFIVAVVIGITSGDSEGLASFVSVVRDLFIIFLTMQAILICVALVVLILQLSALLNVLQNEIEPIVMNMQETTSTLRGTAEFMKERAVRPVVRTSSVIAGGMAVLREVAGINRAVRMARANGGKESASAEPETPPTSSNQPETSG